ncbi:hypothetical protein SAMN04488024_11065 [Pedobacter soli]|uniref:Uncharacterized protein n=1 Tax=Pedobacter soli TaxID=390242 RepID=A0A1G6ZD80_9SPHI|nr:hypothetical protein SAMN04488024_11065 [Pedobacter soli]
MQDGDFIRKEFSHIAVFYLIRVPSFCFSPIFLTAITIPPLAIKFFTLNFEAV